MVRDTWQAVLVLVVGTLLLEAAGLRRRGPAEPAAAPPTVATQLQPMPAWQQQTPIVVTSEPERPLRRVASAVTELFDSAIGVIR